MADTGTADTSTDETADDADSITDDLGDAGKRALSDERAARRNAEKATKAARAEIERLKAAGASEADKAIAKAKAEGVTEATTLANARILKAEVRAAAAGKLNDPADAVHFLNLTDFEVSDDGDVDSKAIGKAIDLLLKEKPYLAKGETRRTIGSADGGARGGADKPAPDMNAWLRGEPGVRL